MRTTIFALASLVSLSLALGCDKAKPDSPAGATNSATNGAPGAAPKAAVNLEPVALPTPQVDAAVKSLLTDGDPGVVGRVRLGAWADLAPSLSTIAERVGDPMVSSGFDALGKKGLVAAFEDVVPPDIKPTPPKLGAVDTSRPLWLSLRLRGSGQSWGLFRLGVSLISFHEPLIGWEVVALVPAKDPDALARELSPFGLESSTAGKHLRVRYLSEVPILRGEKLPELTPVAPLPWRMTPALARFLSEDAAAAAYVRVGDLRVLTAANGLMDALRAIRYATPENRQKLLAMGTSVATSAFLNAPRSIAEFEDHTLSLGGDAEAEGAFVDVTSTRTAFGRQVQAAAARVVTLPTISEAKLPTKGAIIDASYSYDITGVAPLFEPFFEATRGPRKDLASADAGRVARRLRNGGVYNYLTLLANSPLQLPSLLSSRAPRDLTGDLRPIAARVRVLKTNEDGSPSLAAAVFAFAGDAKKLEELLPQLRSALPPAVNEALTLEVAPSDGGGVLRASIGVPIAEAFGPDAPLDRGAVHAEFDLVQLAGESRDVNVFAGLGDASLSMLHEPNTSLIRLSVSKKPLPPAAPAYLFEPVTADDVCVDVVSHAVVGAFEEMATLALGEHAKAFDGVRTAAAACAEKVPSPLWALLPHRISLWSASLSTPGGASEAAEKACAAGDEAGCVGKGYYDMIGEFAAPR